MELFEQIRREYEYGVGTIKGVARKLEIHRRMVRKACEGYIEAQKSVIEHIVKQTASLVENAKHSGNSAQKFAADLTKTIQQSIERAVEVQKKALDLVTQEAKAPTASKRTA